MTERDSFYLVSMLHEVGKFIGLLQLPELEQRAAQFASIVDNTASESYLRYSAALIEYIRTQNPDLFPDDSLTTSSFFTHREKGVLGASTVTNVLSRFIQTAADCASGETGKQINSNAGKSSPARLHSIFNEISLKSDDGSERIAPSHRFIDINPLSIEEEAEFPAHSSTESVEPIGNLYRNLGGQFLEAFSQCGNADVLLYLLYKYLHSIPAETTVDSDGSEKPLHSAVNLYDHLRTTAAIALCFYEEYMKGNWKGQQERLFSDSGNGFLNQDLPAPCILISGDLSGIQDFIFNIPSKKAAKSLKGRSYFVQLLAEVCVRKLLDDLDLKPVNLLFNGGGNFFILAPASKQKDFELSSERISKALLEQKSELSVNLASVPIEVNDFSDFSGKWDEVKMAVNRSKRLKHQNLDIEDVFKPFAQSTSDDVDPYIDLTNRLVQSNSYLIKKTENLPAEKGWSKTLNELGYEVIFSLKNTVDIQNDVILFNDCAFEGKATGFTFAVKSLPQWGSQTAIDKFKELLSQNGCRLPEDEEQGRNSNGIKTFEDLAGHAYIETGTAKLGILKMDVDNLGKIFSAGLDTENGHKSPARMMVLSRQLKWFFEGYMNKLIEAFEGTLYPIFSGGDDFFLVGAWHDVFDFARKINEAFSRFVCHHPGITLSASLLVVDDHYPVSRFAVLAEERLHKAKYESLEKNCINVFGQNLNWDEFDKAWIIKSKLQEHVKDYGEAKAVIQKVLRSCEGLELMYDRALRLAKAKQSGNSSEHQGIRKHKPERIKVWRLAYYLREMKEYSNIFVEDLVKEYESAFFNSLQGDLVNPMYIAVGARWAEMAVRGKKSLATKTNDNDG